MIEYDVIWDGAHHQRDEDLLCAELRHGKVRGGPLRDGRASLAQVLAVLPTSRQFARSFRELVIDSRCSGQTVNGVLCTLRREGQLQSEPMLGRVSQHLGRRPQRYWRRT